MKYATYHSLDKQRVLVTGGGTGIGAAMVAAFAGQGAQVYFIDIAVDAARALWPRVSMPRRCHRCSCIAT